MPLKPRIIYMGTPEFAVPGLKLLHEHGYEIVGVVTAPDKPAGRGLQLQASEVKQFAVSVGLPVLQPEKLRDEAFLDTLRNLKADLQVVVAFRMLPEIVWAMPPLGTFNLHASLLPQYRGAAPINWAIINGETETGVTTFFLKQEIDTGDLLLQEKEPIYYEDTVATLYERLMHKGAGLLLKTVQQIEKGQIMPIPQPVAEQLHTAPKIFKEQCLIDFNRSTRDVYNFIRGLSPYPCAHMQLGGKYCRVFTAIEESAPAPLAPGKIRSNSRDRIWIGTSDGAIAITSLQLEGKKRMDTKAFLLGNTLTDLS